MCLTTSRIKRRATITRFLRPRVASLGLCEALGIEKLQQYMDCAVNTVDITFWIENLVWPVP